MRPSPYRAPTARHDDVEAPPYLSGSGERELLPPFLVVWLASAARVSSDLARHEPVGGEAALARERGLVVAPDRASYYLGRETLVTTGTSKMLAWRKRLFAFISRNARTATAYFRLPPNRVVELGVQIQL